MCGAAVVSGLCNLSHRVQLSSAKMKMCYCRVKEMVGASGPTGNVAAATSRADIWWKQEVDFLLL